ncbi:MAG: DNA-directed DNA polymerase [Methanimicrococcus sp.]|nr:DNA-directed DNA polymerase [Methanimicrococcus sp.]
MIFQILDADYKLLGEDEPVIRLFGRSEDGESVCCLVPGFEPFFYAKSAAPEITQKELLEKFSQIVRVDIVDRYDPIGYQTKKTPYLKIIVKAPRNVPEIRDEVSKMPGVSALFESDILFRNRFLVDMNLGGFQWAEAFEDETLDRTRLIEEIPIKADTIICTKSVAPLDRISNAPMRYLSFDIECLPDDGNMPTPEKSPVILVSFSFEPAWNGKKTVVYVGKPKPDGFNYETNDADGDTIWLENESELLAKTFETMNEYDPDFITGYNISDFDIPYLLRRSDVLKKRGAAIRTGIARDGSPVYSKKFGLTVKTEITGRIVADALPLIRRNFSLKQYTLKNAAKELLGRDKLDLPPAEMEEHWADGGEKLAKFVNYSRRDSELAMELLLHLKILDKYVALARITNSVVQETLDGGQTSMVEQVMLKEYGKHDRVMPVKPDGEEYEERDSEDELKGGAVLDPVRGLHENVIVLDYKSLYPTIMMAHNLCYTTLVNDMRDLEALGLTEKDVDVTPTGGIFVKQEIVKGIVPAILGDLLNRRMETKQLMKQTKDEQEILALDATQLALKILLNSYYGYTGYARARLYSMAMASSVTSIGRENILNTERIITQKIGKLYIYENRAWLEGEIKEEFTKAGKTIESDFDSGKISDLDSAVIAGAVKLVRLSVVYGDTDSVFMHCASETGEELSPEQFTLEDAALAGTKTASIVTASLPAPMELEFEAVARRAVLIAKKRYAQWIFERSGDGWSNKIKVKGMETVRRDWCELTSETLSRVLELVLIEGDVDEAIKYVRDVTNELRNMDLNKNPEFIQKLILTKNYSKRMESYKNKQPHLTVVEKIKSRTGISTPIGTRVPFVIISGKGLFVERAEDPEFVLKHNIPLDTEYYIKKQILPPVERILEVFGVDSGFLDKYQQKGLFDFGAPASPKKAAPASDFKKEKETPAPIHSFEDTGPSKASAYREEAAEDVPETFSGDLPKEFESNDLQNENETPDLSETIESSADTDSGSSKEAAAKTDRPVLNKPQKSLFDF